MLARYSGCNDMVWQMNPMRKAFHCSAPEIVLCSICNALFPPFRFFQHDSFVSNHAACEMYISWLFLYTSATWEGSICLDILILTSVCLHIFLTDSGWCNMAWQMMSLPLLGGIFWMWSKNYFWSYVYFCISPKSFFQHHEFGGNCKWYNMYISLWLLYKFSCIHAYMCLHFDLFTYFCLGMLGIDCGWGDMAWQIEPLIFDWRLQWHFVQWTSPSGSDIVWNSHLCHMCEYFYIFEHILPH